MQKVSGTFDQLLTAPSSGFETDSSLVMAPGEVLAIESPHNVSGDVCQFAVSPNIYVKIGVDSVNLATRIIYLRMGFDPNCGFRSFATGIPTS